MTTEAEVYRGAASLIRKHGWVQGQLGNGKLGFCLVGGVRQFLAPGSIPIFVRSDEGPVIERLRYLTGYQLLGCWNDKPERTVEDVLTLLEQAATEAEKEASRG